MNSDEKTPAEKEQRVVLVTGPSGAGRSTAINALEDLGYEAIDNLPLSLLPRLLDGPPLDHPLALGIDVRNRDFDVSAMIDMIYRLVRLEGVNVELLYLDSSVDVLVRRYSETRRRHPLSPDQSAIQGIRRELDLLVPIRSRADVLLETSDMTPHDLRAEVERWFAPKTGQRLAISVHSFSYKRGVPRGIDMIFDCRFLKNPHWEQALRALDGRDQQVADYIATDPRFAAFFQKIQELVEMLLPAYIDEGKSHFTIGFGCTGGQHRSVAVAEKLVKGLAHTGWQVSIRHREMERKAQAGPEIKRGDMV